MFQTWAQFDAFFIVQLMANVLESYDTIEILGLTLDHSRNLARFRRDPAMFDDTISRRFEVCNNIYDKLYLLRVLTYVPSLQNHAIS